MKGQGQKQKTEIPKRYAVQLCLMHGSESVKFSEWRSLPFHKGTTNFQNFCCIFFFFWIWTSNILLYKMECATWYNSQAFPPHIESVTHDAWLSKYCTFFIFFLLVCYIRGRVKRILTQHTSNSQVFHLFSPTQVSRVVIVALD